MNKLFSILLISFFFVNIYAQDCINLNITKHLYGDPICLLKKGDKVEICLISKTIQANDNCYYHILSKKTNLFGSLIYEFGLDPNTPFFNAPVYGRLNVNTKSKTLIFKFKYSSSKALYLYENDNIPKKESDVEIKNLNLSQNNPEQSYEDLILEINEKAKKGDYQNAFNKYNLLWHKYSW